MRAFFSSFLGCLSRAAGSAIIVVAPRCTLLRKPLLYPRPLHNPPERAFDLTVGQGQRFTAFPRDRKFPDFNPIAFQPARSAPRICHDPFHPPYRMHA